MRIREKAMKKLESKTENIDTKPKETEHRGYAKKSTLKALNKFVRDGIEKVNNLSELQDEKKEELVARKYIISNKGQVL